MTRAWDSLTCRKGFHNNELSELMKTKEDVDKFNFLFKTKAQNINQIIKLQKRIMRKGIDIKSISKSRKYFDMQTLKLKLPEKKKIAFTLMFAALFLFGGVLLLQIPITPAALVKFKNSDTWIWVNKEHAENYIPSIPFNHLFFDDWKFDKNKCTGKKTSIAQLSAITKLTEPEIAAICNQFKSSGDPFKINKTISSQKILYFFCLIPLCFFLKHFREFLYMMIAYDLGNFLLKNKRNLP